MAAIEMTIPGGDLATSHYPNASGIVMMLDNFRAKLRKEAQLWRDEGLINPALYTQLAERYQFNKLEAAARDRFVFLLIGIGCILLASGAITFIAANWDVWSREAKVVLLISLFIGTSITGFSFWREGTSINSEGKKPPLGKKLLGEGLLFIAALILGANLALMGQLFQINRSTYELFLAWGLSVLAMSWGLRLTSLGILGIVLTQIGYWFGLGELPNSGTDLTWARLIVQHMPLFSWLTFVPLAYWVRSRWIFASSAFAFASSLQLNVNSLQLLSYSQAAPWLASFAFVLPPALFWSYDDLLFPEINYRLFQPLARSLALLFFGFLFYILSFSWWWQNALYISRTNYNSVLRFFPLIDLGILSGLAVLQWLYLLRHRPNRQHQGIDITSVFIGSFILITALVPFLHQASSRFGVFAVFTFNVLLALLAGGLIREGLQLGKRRPFWSGLMLLTLQIISRMLESDSGLLFKSLVFILCGWGVISAGLWFEARLNNLSKANSPK
jgi:uncharacterized membrane protein